MIAEEIFLKALEKKTPVERAAYLDGACGENAELRAEVESLIASDAEAGNFLEQSLFSPSGDTIEHAPISERTGSMIGHYKLLEKIGEGGFGVVFMAEQQKPVVRKVALKIIKPGMDTREVVARFEAERQALAIMDHPNIARVLDGGETESGRPYFVMELVKGIPITDYCDQRNLTPDERLQLFAAVCHAVQHAHQKGVIHRDIKPNNVLITLHDGQPVVKVIDFGVAKAINQRLTEKTLFTRFSQMVGTPLYMSPEQAELSGLEVDTRTDIYALGVLLYELLTGTTPFDRDRLRDAAYDEIRRIIREEDPPKPSTRISTLGDALTAVCSHRQTEPQRLTRIVKGDLDWIVMKALEKDRDRRYETANGFAADIDRYLKHEPVTACPPSLGYRARKYWQRNSQLVVTAAAILTLLIVGLIGTTSGWLAYREKHIVAVQRGDQIEMQKKEIEATQHALTTQLLASVRGAQPTEFTMSVANVKPIQERAVPLLRDACDDANLPLDARINCALALAALGESARVADFLLQQLDAVPPALSGEFIRVMQDAPVVAGRFGELVARAEADKNLERWARLAIVALYLDNREFARDMLRFRADNLLRTSFLRTFAQWHGPIADLASVARAEEDIALRTGVAEAAGLVPAQESVVAQRQVWLPLLTEWFTNAKDATTRSTAEWLLRQWEVSLPDTVLADEAGVRGWTKGPGDLIMVHVPAGEFTMGTLGVSPSAQRVRITHPFLISDRQVSISLFQQFIADKGITEELEFTTSDTTQAMHNANWHALRAFLNWLSEREGLDPCYIEERDAIGGLEYALRRDANGYRLPTEAEWEYVCRAGTITDCFYGPKYEETLYSASSFKRVSCLPNGWGLFDMYSKAGEVVEDKHAPLPLTWGVAESVIDPLNVVRQQGRANVVVRGAGSGSSTQRWKLAAAAAKWPVAFRVARNAPDAPSGFTVCLRPVDYDEASLTRLTALSADGCAPHWSEIARERINDGDVNGAARSVDDLLPHMPPQEDPYSPRSQFLTRLAHHAEVFSQLVTRRPDDTHVRICRGRYYAFHEMWADAASEFESAIEGRGPRNSRWQDRSLDRERTEYAVLLMYASRESDYLAFRKRLMTEAEAYPDDLDSVWTMLKTSTLAPLNDADSRQHMQRWWEHMTAKGWITAGFPPSGLAAYRLGRYDQVFELLGKNEGARCGPILAMAHWRQGNVAVARDLIARQQRRELPLLRDGWPGYFDFVDVCLSHNLLLAEAEREIFGTEESRLAEQVKQQAQDKGSDSQEYWQAKYDLAQVIARQPSRRDHAVQLYDEIYENQARILGVDHPDTKATAKRLAEVIFDMAWVVMWTPHTEEEYQKAFRLLQRAHQVVPDDVKYAVPVAWGYYRSGNPDEAARQLDAVASQVGVFAGDTWFLRAILAQERGDQEEAQNWFLAGSYLVGTTPVGTQRLAMDCLGRYDLQPPTDAKLFESLGFLISRYDDDYNLYVQRGVAHVRAQMLVEAHRDFRKAFDLCPSLEIADWLAMTSQLTDQSEDGAMATARLHELIQDGGKRDVGEMVSLVQAYCLYASTQDYSAVTELINATAGEDQDPNVLLTRAMAQFRNGQEVQLVPIRNDDDPQSTVLSMCFTALAQYRAGQREAARQQLTEARNYAESQLAAPDGPDFPGAQRARAWTASQILLKEVAQTVLPTNEEVKHAE